MKFVRVLALTLVAGALTVGCESKKSPSGSDAKAGKAADQGKALPAEQGGAKSDQEMVQQLQGSEWQLDKEEKVVKGHEQGQEQAQQQVFEEPAPAPKEEGKQEQEQGKQEQEQGGKEEQLADQGKGLAEPKVEEPKSEPKAEEPKQEQAQQQEQVVVEEKLAEQIQEEKVVDQVTEEGKQESVKEIYPKTVKFEDSKTVTINDKHQGEFKVEQGELKIETPKAEEKLQVQGGKVQIQDNTMKWTQEQTDQFGTTQMTWTFRRIR